MVRSAAMILAALIILGIALAQQAQGVLQVVGLADETSAARVVTMRDAVFEQGVVLRLTKKMR